MKRNFEIVSDEVFLKQLDADRNKVYFVEITVLDMDEKPLQAIQGKVSSGSISVNGKSSVRRTCQLTFNVDNDEQINYNSLNSILSINKKVKIVIGLQNKINAAYGDIIGFPQGIFVINQISISHGINNVTVSMSCKDKMCLLNGECGGNLPSSIIFDSYDQLVGYVTVDTAADLPDVESGTVSEYTVYKVKNDAAYPYRVYSADTLDYKKYKTPPYTEGERISIPQKMYDIIQTLVINYGKENPAKVIINDLPLKIKQLVRWTGAGKLYYQNETKIYTTDIQETESGTWRTFNYNEDVGYIWEDFTYPGALVSSISDNVCSVLDKIAKALGNYEYFYDVNGNFIFQEIKNYLNTSYDATVSYRMDNVTNRIISSDDIAIYTKDGQESLNNITILDDTNYYVNFSQNTKSVYTFDNNLGLISSFSNNPVYNNVKNDFHIWGKGSGGLAIHFHLAIKEKPHIFNTYKVKYYDDETHADGQLYLADDGIDYIPTDWRAELYLQGLTKQRNQQRPDVYEQELLDLFDSIYNFKEKCFRANIITNPNDLIYWFDYLEPVDSLSQYSVEAIGSRIYTTQNDKICKLYNTEAPDVILISNGADPAVRQDAMARCEQQGVPYTNIMATIFDNISVGTEGYSAEDYLREALYQYTNYNESITIQCLPIYHLEVNNRITVRDTASNIFGDYIINSISVPLDAKSMMSIQASRALDRI